MLGLVEQVKAYERLTVQAAVDRRPRRGAAGAMANPLVRSYDVARPLLDALLSAHRAHLPQFFA